MIRVVMLTLAVLTGLSVLLFAHPARADQNCILVCDNGACTVEHEHCIETNMRPLAVYGAIAYGRESGAWGTSYHWRSRAEAERVALRNGAPHGNDCAVAVWFRNECGAVAAGRDGAPYWGIGDGVGLARASALAKCRNGGGSACAIVISQCSR